jgi:hypothetical protein
MIAMKPPHKFFDRFLDNNLDEMYTYLEMKQDELLAGTLTEIPREELSKYNKDNGAATQLGKYYNIFNFTHPSVQALKSALRDIMIEASEYYGLDFEANKFAIKGWFNYDPKTIGTSGVNPLKNERFFHDHMGGEGAPVFHGYYCVNAEPSSTFYKINGVDAFENINKNNRAIVSETGHPHGRDDWYQDKPRITIAYDIAPAVDGLGNGWIEL